MHFTRSTAAAALVAALPVAFAQTYTDCNPTQKSCPADTGLATSSFTTDFTQGASSNTSWSAAAYTFINYGNQGAEFTIAKDGQAPTIETDFYFLFGRVDVTMQAAPGTGIISSIVLESDDLDEIDWEFLGGNTTVVETNFFGKGNTTSYDRAIYYPVANPQSQFHTYSLDWTPSQLQFIIDGTVVRTLLYNEPLTLYGANYPQTPMRLKLGNWAGGASGEPEGTVEWAGGPTDFSKAPFTMIVSKVSITNYTPAQSYEWTDLSGSYQSIKAVNSTTGDSSTSGNSTSTSTGDSSSATDSSNTTALVPTSSLSVVVPQGTGAVVSTTLTSNYTASSTGMPSSTSGAPTSTVSPHGSAGNMNTVAFSGGLLTVALGFFCLL